MTSPNLTRAGSPDELSLQSKFSGPLHWSSVQTPFDTGLVRTEVPTSYCHGTSLETLCAGTRINHHYKRCPPELSPSFPLRGCFLISSE